MDNLLNPREKAVLNYIIENVRTKGYPPSVREIGKAVGLSSSSTVHTYLKKLEQKGMLRRDPTKPRAIEVLSTETGGTAEPRLPFDYDENLVQVPVLGQVAAGVPLLAVENHDESLVLPREFTGFGDFFMLKVRGDSMIEAGILEGDLVLVRKQPNAENGDIVVAMMEGEATLKRFYREKECIRLQPENSRLLPILVREVQIVGKAVGLLRNI